MSPRNTLARLTDRQRLDQLVAQLRERDHDPAYATAPVKDAYGRISKTPDTGETEKVDRQLVDILTKMLGERVRLGEVLRDDGKSAWNLRAKRKGWDRLLERLAKGQCHGAVVWHVDRMFRQPPDLERLVAMAERGMDIGSCFGDKRLDDPDDLFILRVQVAHACKSSSDSSRRIKRKVAAAREAGVSSRGGRRMFGFPYYGDEPSKVVGPELIAAEREAILWGAKRLVAGGTVASVVREWGSRGLVAPAGGEIGSELVIAVMRRGRNAGLVTHEVEVTDEEGNLTGATKCVVVGVMADEPNPILSRDLYDQLQAVIAARRRGRPAGEAALLSGFLRCGKCFNRMIKSTKKGQIYSDGTTRMIYRCSSFTGCAGVGVDLRAADEWAVEKTLDVLSDPAHAAMVARKSAALAAVEQRLDAAVQTSVELSRRLGLGEMKLANFDAAMEPLRLRIADLEAEQTALLDAGAAQSTRELDRAKLTLAVEAMTHDERRATVRRAMPFGILCAPRAPGVEKGDRLSVLAEHLSATRVRR
jgi:site-specific DNA recombinase